VPAESRADVALVEPVAGLADDRELLLAEDGARLVALPVRDELLVLAARDDFDVSLHPRVLDPAELGTPRDIRADRRFEPEVVRLARDRVELAAELRYPPAVIDVVRRGDDRFAHDLVRRRVHRSDRDRSVRIPEHPVELAALDGDPRLVRRARGRGTGDAGELVEDERADRNEDQHGEDGPDDLEARRAVDLGALGGARAAAAPVADREEDQRAFDDQEDRAGEAEHEQVRRRDPVRVRRLRRRWQQSAVAGRCRLGEEERADDPDTEENAFAHAAWHRTNPWRAARGLTCRRTSGSRTRSSSTRFRSRRGRITSWSETRSSSAGFSRARGGSASGAGRRCCWGSPAPTASTRRSASSTSTTAGGSSPTSPRGRTRFDRSGDRALAALPRRRRPPALGDRRGARPALRALRLAAHTRDRRRVLDRRGDLGRDRAPSAHHDPAPPATGRLAAALLPAPARVDRLVRRRRARHPRLLARAGDRMHPARLLGGVGVRAHSGVGGR